MRLDATTSLALAIDSVAGTPAGQCRKIHEAPWGIALPDREIEISPEYLERLRQTELRHAALYARGVGRMQCGVQCSLA